jgi:hypothetical protein
VNGPLNIHTQVTQPFSLSLSLSLSRLVSSHLRDEKDKTRESLIYEMIGTKLRSNLRVVQQITEMLAAQVGPTHVSGCAQQLVVQITSPSK